MSWMDHCGQPISEPGAKNYNRKRLYYYLGHMSPVEFEAARHAA
jgi:hypothetical protein